MADASLSARHPQDPYYYSLAHDSPDDCSVCEAGKIVTVEGSPSCEKCEGGTYLEDTGTDASLHDNTEDCSVCGANMYSLGGSASCTNCEVGKYLVDAGTFASKHDEEEDCRFCPGGEKLNAGNDGCELCEEGKYSGPWSTECTDCDHTAGFVHVTDRTDCLFCGAGFFANKATHTCDQCVAGKFSIGGVDECLTCDASVGLVSTGEQRTHCTYCASERRLTQQRTNALIAKQDSTVKAARTLAKCAIARLVS